MARSLPCARRFWEPGHRWEVVFEFQLRSRQKGFQILYLGMKIKFANIKFPQKHVFRSLTSSKVPIIATIKNFGHLWFFSGVNNPHSITLNRGLSTTLDHLCTARNLVATTIVLQVGGTKAIQLYQIWLWVFSGLEGVRIFFTFSKKPTHFFFSEKKKQELVYNFFLEVEQLNVMKLLILARKKTILLLI